MPEDYRR
ncbi:hypothetical protein ECFRIK1985_2458, partial [Escherichia coli FRIK1985]